ncbi:MAG: hypothetical protein JW797_20220 [Bradymonadales bacterium]|nr:hypothetical protein [Bradymonadales bacterium]
MSGWDGRYAIIAGPRGSGKTTTAMQVVSHLAREGWSVGGVVQPVVLENGQRIGYDLVAFGQGLGLCPPLDLVGLLEEVPGEPLARSSRPRQALNQAFEQASLDVTGDKNLKESHADGGSTETALDRPGSPAVTSLTARPEANRSSGVPFKHPTRRKGRSDASEAGAHGAPGESGRSSRFRVPLTRGPFGEDLPPFFDEAWSLATDAIRQASRSAQVLLVDELGWAESLGRGHLPALLAAAGGHRPVFCVATVRLDCLFPLLRLLGAPVRRWDLPGSTGEVSNELSDLLWGMGLRAEAGSWSRR